MAEASGLTKKLCEVGQALTWVKKRGKNTFHGYNYATEADLVLAIRLELYKRNIFLLPNVVESKREGYTDEKQKRQNLVELIIEWTWIDGDTGERLASRMPGAGEDRGDKGTYKAITGSEKYLLLKTFLIPTFDDAEQMAPDDKKALQQRVAQDKTAELKAKVEAQHAQSPEDAERIAKKGQILHITMPDRYKGEFAAVYGTPIIDAALTNYFADCDAQRFKGPEGIHWKLPIQYARDCKVLGERQGYTVDWQAA